MLIGCQATHTLGRWYTHSPRSPSELGIIVDDVSETDIHDLIRSKTIAARALSVTAGTYEVYGVSPRQIEELFPRKPYYENQFIDFKATTNELTRTQASPPQELPQHLIIQAPRAWLHSRGQGAVVGIVDSGLNWNHADFSLQKKLPRHTTGWNFGDSNADVSDPTDHGTSVAGLIVSSKLGIAPEAQVVPLKVMNSSYRIDEGSVIAAIRYALENDIQLIHISLGKPSVSAIFLNLLKEVENRGSLIVAAAGNQGRSCDEFKQYPASLDSFNILSVGATLVSLSSPFTWASYSNFGDCVAIAAPGGDLPQPLWAPVWKNSQSLYAPVMGTSMAAPLVMGAAALLKSLHPQWDGPQLREALLQNAKRSSLLEGRVRSEGLLSLEFIDKKKNSNQTH